MYEEQKKKKDGHVDVNQGHDEDENIQLNNRHYGGW